MTNRERAHRAVTVWLFWSYSILVGCAGADAPSLAVEQDCTVTWPVWLPSASLQNFTDRALRDSWVSIDAACPVPSKRKIMWVWTWQESESYGTLYCSSKHCVNHSPSLICSLTLFTHANNHIASYGAV